jgi:hypothetical protein
MRCAPISVPKGFVKVATMRKSRAQNDDEYKERMKAELDAFVANERKFREALREEQMKRLHIADHQADQSRRKD